MKRVPGFLAAAALAAAIAPAAPAATSAPAATRTTLPNGLTVILQPSSRLPLVDFQLVVRAGAVNDPVGKDGLASLTAELLTQGAGKRTAKQLADDIEFVGGDLSASAGAEAFTVSCEVLKKDFATGLELFRDVVVSPTFAAEEFARKKDEALGEIASNRNEPSVIAEQEFNAFLWGPLPLGRPAIGREKSVQALARDDVADFHRRFVAPNRATLVVVGDLDPAGALAAIQAAFAAWPRSAEPLRDPYAAPGQVRGRQIRVIDKPEATQAQIRLGCIAFPRNHPDWFPVQVVNTILGDGFTSRLVNSVRVEKGLTYSIGSSFRTYRAAGAFRIGTFTRNEKLRPCMDAVLAEVGKLVAEGPTPAEFEKSRNYLMSQYPLGLQAPDDLAGEIATNEFYGLDPKFIENYNANVRAVTMDDCRRVLKQYFCTDDLRIVVVTQAGVATKALEGLGAVEVRPIE